MSLIEEISSHLKTNNCVAAIKTLQQYAERGYPVSLIASLFCSIIASAVKIINNKPQPQDIVNLCIFSGFSKDCSPDIFEDSQAESISFSNNEDPDPASITPIFSVIMPTYNRYPVFLPSIYTALIQNNSNFELIVSDDCSDDSTSEFMNLLVLNMKKLKYIRNNKNSGAAEARNKAFNISSGKYIAFLDSDNIWKYNYLSTAQEYMSENLHIYRKYIDCILDPKTGELLSFQEKGEPFYYERLCANNYIDLNSYIISRKYFQLIGGFHSELKRRQDWQLLLKASWAIPPYFDISSAKVLYQRNQSWGQISHLQSKEKESKSVGADTINKCNNQEIHYPISSSYAKILDICFVYSYKTELNEQLNRDDSTFFNYSSLEEINESKMLATYKSLGKFYFIKNASSLKEAHSYESLKLINRGGVFNIFLPYGQKISTSIEALYFQLSKNIYVLFDCLIKKPSTNFSKDAVSSIRLLGKHDKNYLMKSFIDLPGLLTFIKETIYLENIQSLEIISGYSLVIYSSSILLSQFKDSNIRFYDNLSDYAAETCLFSIYNIDHFLGELISKVGANRGCFMIEDLQSSNQYLFFCGNFILVTDLLLDKLHKLEAANYRYLNRYLSQKANYIKLLSYQ